MLLIIRHLALVCSNRSNYSYTTESEPEWKLSKYSAFFSYAYFPMYKNTIYVVCLANNKRDSPLQFRGLCTRGSDRLRYGDGILMEERRLTATNAVLAVCITACIRYDGLIDYRPLQGNVHTETLGLFVMYMLCLIVHLHLSFYEVIEHGLVQKSKKYREIWRSK